MSFLLFMMLVLDDQSHPFMTALGFAVMISRVVN